MVDVFVGVFELEFRFPLHQRNISFPLELLCLSCAACQYCQCDTIWATLTTWATFSFKVLSDIVVNGCEKHKYMKLHIVCICYFWLNVPLECATKQNKIISLMLLMLMLWERVCWWMSEFGPPIHIEIYILTSIDIKFVCQDNSRL